MTLREQVHRSIDQLDDEALALIHKQLQALETASVSEGTKERVPTIEEVLEMTSSDTSNWAAELIAERDDRV